jgi:hypothetical protein
VVLSDTESSRASDLSRFTARRYLTVQAGPEPKRRFMHPRNTPLRRSDGIGHDIESIGGIVVDSDSRFDPLTDFEVQLKTEV